MRGSLIKFLIVPTAVIMLTGRCAKQVSPTGGPKDTEPPKIVKSLPPAGTTGFYGKSIVVTFDEYIAFDKLNEKFMVSPPMELKPKIYLRGKNLNIEFQEKLKDSTTYTLYFQDAIKDLNEGNPFNNFEYVLSTGKVIDSLSVTGNVLLADNLEPDKNILILLHRRLDDSIPRKTLPDYITMADVNGGFRINNIREGNYKIYALRDNNNNKKYDLSDEEFAFSDSIININPQRNYLPERKDTTSVKLKEKEPARPPLIAGQHKLFLFTAPKTAYYLPTTPSRKSQYQLTFILSLPPDTLDFEVEFPEVFRKDYYTEKSYRGDTINIWLLDSAVFNRQEIRSIVKYPFTDSTGKVVYKKDTIPLRYMTARVPKFKTAKTPFRYGLNIKGNSISPGQQLVFTSLTPFRRPDTTKIRFYEVDPKGKKALQWSLLKDSMSAKQYFFSTKTKEGGNYNLVTLPGAFGNIYGENSDSSSIKFSVRETNSFGHLELDIQNGEGDLIIQLLDNNEAVVAERKLMNSGKVDFPLLEKGFYKARVIYDLNGDGRWTTGNYDKKLQPEPVSYYPDELEVKIDWIITQPWDVSKKNFKNPVTKDKKEQRPPQGR